MKPNRTLLLAILFLVRQAAGVARCTTATASGLPDCDDSCNEVGTCLANGVWQRTQNCQASGNVCRYDSTTLAASCVDVTTSGAAYCKNLYIIDCPAVTTTVRIPSLLDCTSYYICTPGDLQIGPSQCGGSAFNSCTGQCTDSLTNGVCPTSTTTYCTYVGQVGIAPGNDALYYTCNGNLQPVWGACGSGYRYSIASGSCVYVGAVSGCTVCASATTVPGPLPYSNSVCSYLWCHSSGNFELRNCLTGWYYVHTERGCIYGGGSTIVC